MKKKKNRNGLRLLGMTGAAAVLFLTAVGVGSVQMSIADVVAILRNGLFGAALPENISTLNASILMRIRLPRVCMAFLCGAMLSISGAVMQSVLRNPLASSYTLGVSSGASLGAAFVLLLGVQLPLIPTMTLPAAGFVLGLAAVLAAMGLSARFDADMRSGTIILTGMVLSLFINAIITLLCALKKEYLNQLVFWQMGSFSGGSMKQNAVLLAVLAVCVPLLLRLSAEMDILTFGDDLAATSGFSPRKARGKLIVLSTLLTGTAVSFCGTIGFVDLIVPHLARKLFGARHRWLVPASAVLGGALMVLSDLAARTVLSPKELPVGAVTALIGAPFFAYVYFSRRKGGRAYD